MEMTFDDEIDDEITILDHTDADLDDDFECHESVSVNTDVQFVLEENSLEYNSVIDGKEEVKNGDLRYELLKKDAVVDRKSICNVYLSGFEHNVEKLAVQIAESEGLTLEEVKKKYEVNIDKFTDEKLTEAIMTCVDGGRSYYNNRRYNGYKIKLNFKSDFVGIDLLPAQNFKFDGFENKSYFEKFKSICDKDGTMKTHGIVTKELADKLVSDFGSYLGEFKSKEIKVGQTLNGTLFNNLVDDQISYFPDMMILNAHSFDKLLTELKMQKA